MANGNFEGSKHFFVGFLGLGLNFVDSEGVGKVLRGTKNCWIACSHLVCRFPQFLIALQFVLASLGIVRWVRNLRLNFSVRRNAETLIWFLEGLNLSRVIGQSLTWISNSAGARYRDFD